MSIEINRKQILKYEFYFISIFHLRNILMYVNDLMMSNIEDSETLYIVIVSNPPQKAFKVLFGGK